MDGMYLSNPELQNVLSIIVNENEIWTEPSENRVCKAMKALSKEKKRCITLRAQPERICTKVT